MVRWERQHKVIHDKTSLWLPRASFSFTSMWWDRSGSTSSFLSTCLLILLSSVNIPQGTSYLFPASKPANNTFSILLTNHDLPYTSEVVSPPRWRLPSLCISGTLWSTVGSRIIHHFPQATWLWSVSVPGFPKLRKPIWSSKTVENRSLGRWRIKFWTPWSWRNLIHVLFMPWVQSGPLICP